MARFRSLAGGVTAMLLLSGCGGGGGGEGSAPAQPPPAAPPPLPQQPGAMFRDITAQTGIDFELALPRLGQISDATFGGVAAGDYNGNGYIDLFIVRGGNAPNLLYKNVSQDVGHIAFVEVAAEAGLANTKSLTENYNHSGPTFADMNGNGHLDLFIGGLVGDPSLIFQNNGDGTFTDVTDGSGIDELGAAHTMSAAFGDYDLDGYLDLAVSHWATERDARNPGDTEHLWRNVSGEAGRIKFESVSVEAGISPSILTLPNPAATERRDTDFTFTPTFARINDDHYPDLLMAADFNTSQVFLNNGDGTFENVTDVWVIRDDNGMGSAVGDYNNNGHLDWFVTSIYAPRNSLPAYPGATGPRIGNRLYRNNGDGTFTDVTDSAGVADGGWGWAACFADLDNDGHLDIYHTNGWRHLGDEFLDYSEDQSRAFISNGEGGFDERAAELGLADTYSGRGVVCADFDNDGDVDILVLHDQGGTLYENIGNSNNYLRVQLKGLPPNTEAAGARIYATIGAQTQMREIMIGSNYTSQNPTVQLFGLGPAAMVDELVVEWPGGGETTTMSMVDANQTLVLEHPTL
jgi:enediyne biosynthesis protein E4